MQAHPALFVRWSRGPEADAGGTSKDELTGGRLPGLSANPLAVEPWWQPRPLRLWIARRLHDYCHLEHEKGPQVRPWVLEGTEAGRGPDNEPLVHCERPVAWIADEVIDEAERVMRDQKEDWGPLRELPLRTFYVQPGHYFVLGDNSPESADSRTWGLVPERLVLGKAFLIYFSWDSNKFEEGSQYNPLNFLSSIRWGRTFRLLH